VFVSDQQSFRIDMLGNGRPGVLTVLVHDHPRQRSVRRMSVRLSERPRARALAVLIFLLAAILALLLLVGLAERPAKYAASRYGTRRSGSLPKRGESPPTRLYQSRTNGKVTRLIPYSPQQTAPECFLEMPHRFAKPDVAPSATF
jgi:hypothetical protein